MRRILPSGAALLAGAFLAGCGRDEPTTPRDDAAQLAQQFSEMAADVGSEEPQGVELAFALQSAASVLRAGGQIGSIEARVDGTGTTFRAIAYEMALSPAACEQEHAFIPDDGLAALPCPAFHGLVAWQQSGDRVDRVLFVSADSGATSFDLGLGGIDDDGEVLVPSSFAFGELYDRGRIAWLTVRGTLSQSRVSLGEPCRKTPQLEAGMEVSCVIASYRHSYDMELRQWDLSNPPLAPVGDGGDDAPSKRIQIAAQTIPGLRFTILRLPAEGGNRH